MRLSGKLTVWDPQGGFGVITPDAGGEDLFVEASDGLQDPPPLLDELLTFDVAQNRDGTRRAVNIIRLSRADAGLLLAPVDTSLNARAALQVQPLYRATPARPPRRVRAPWSFGRVVVTALVVAGVAVLLARHYDTLRGIDVKSLDPSKLLPATPAARTVPRESLAP